MTRPNWDEYGMLLAQAVLTRAACSRRQVGAVILDEQHRVVATGYNGTVSGSVNCSDGGCPRGLLSYDDCPAYGSYSNCVGLHAEHNAIETARERHALNWPEGLFHLTGCTIYVTHVPCADCMERIILVGITNVISPNSRG